MNAGFKMTTFRRLAALCGLIMALLLFNAPGARGQAAAQAEAIERANLRSGPGIEYALVGEIVAGARYDLVGQSARFPWLLLRLPDRQGWVYKDLVRVYGDLFSVPYTEVVLDAPTPTALPIAATAPPATSAPGAPTMTLPAPAAATATPTASVFAEAVERANVRFGPGVDFPVIGSINKGQLYAVLRRHAQFPWLEVAFPEVTGGRGWVLSEIVTISGDLNGIEITNATDFGYPTLTPTPPRVVVNTPPWPVSSSGKGSAVPLEAVSNAMYDMLLAVGFAPYSTRQGSAFLLDLGSGQHFSLNPGVSYSGISLIKVPLMVAFYRKMLNAPDADEARLLAEMIICSENLSSNALLRKLGEGDEMRGAQYVTETMRALGLQNTFLAAPFFTGIPAVGPTPTTAPLLPFTSAADGRQTNADRGNQTTPEDLGWLLAAIYQCERGEGPLLTVFGGEIEVRECRRMLRVLRANKIGSLIEAGVPEGAGALVAHKHGWAADTHGDMAVVFSPGGDFVLTIMLHNPTWLNYDDSFPLIAEAARLTYNAYNPGAPMAAINLREVPLCDIALITAGDPTLLDDLQAIEPPPFR